MKIRQCEKEEKEAGTSYRREKMKVKNLYVGKTMERNFRRMVQRIKRTTNRRWDRALQKVENRVAWLMYKFRKREVDDNQKLWMDEIARGSGASRKRVEVTEPIYGDVDLSEDELNAAKLPKKFAVYNSITEEDIRLEKEIGNTKI